MHGIALVSVTDSWMSGRSAYYVEMIAKAGLVAIHTASSSRMVAPPGGAAAVLGTNPIAIAIPSARGPIVSPHLRALLVTPVSPHMLFDRPLVLDPSETFRLELLAGGPAVLVVDGSCVEQLEPGDAVECRAGPHPARLVTFGKRDFHAILKAKFNLTDR